MHSQMRAFLFPISQPDRNPLRAKRCLQAVLSRLAVLGEEQNEGMLKEEETGREDSTFHKNSVY